MRPDLVLLRDVERAATAAVSFVGALSVDDFIDNDLVRSAVTYKLIVIGEAANRLPPELKDAHPEIPWPQIISFRNRATHAYWRFGSERGVRA